MYACGAAQGCPCEWGKAAKLCSHREKTKPTARAKGPINRNYFLVSSSLITAPCVLSCWDVFVIFCFHSFLKWQNQCPDLFLPVYFESGRTSIPFLRWLSFFAKTQLRDFTLSRSFPFFFFSRLRSLEYGTWSSSISLTSKPLGAGSALFPELPQNKTRKYLSKEKKLRNKREGNSLF